MTTEVLDKIELINIKELFSDTNFNCRGEIIPFDVRSLAQNIEKNGLLQPITVQPYSVIPPYHFRVIVGHRRLLAYKALKKTEIPAIVKENLTDDQAHALNLIENIERQDLNVLQEANAIHRFKLAGMTQKEVAALLGQAAGWVQTRFGLLELPVEIQNEAAAGFLTTDHIRRLVGMDRDTQFETVRKIKDAKLKDGKRLVLPNKKKKKINPNIKRIRSPREIELMQDMIADGIGNNYFTRSLGWAAGYVSDLELLQDIKKYADIQGIPWSIPNEYIAAL